MSTLLTGTFAAEILFAGIGTIAFSVLFFVPRKYYGLCGICGAAGWTIYSVAEWFGVSAAESTFLATLVVIFLSRLFAVMEQCPSTLFVVPGIFPLVPGAGVYWTAYHIVTDNLEMALETGFTAFKVAAAIVLGIIFVFEIPQGVFRRLAGRKKRV